MSESFVLSFAQNAVMVAAILAAPALVTSLIIGSVISLFQSATQIQETTLTFIPKIVGVGLVVAILGSWMIQKLIAFTTNIFTSLPDIIR